MKNSEDIPTILVVFGATGDLMARKIVPALFLLFSQNKLPQLFRVVGFSRRPYEQEDFQKHLLAILKKEEKPTAFLKLFSYHQGKFEDKGAYQSLAQVLEEIDQIWNICPNKLFYLAAPPPFYQTIFENLAASGLTIPCGPQEGWTRVLVEKPFGKDLKTAQNLDKLLSKLFKEEQIYRLDHYLAKEMLQNILAFRFANSLFEPSWNNQWIEKIEIKLLETIGVEKRGHFYDGLGALRDVGQNHLLQMLALVTMDNPQDSAAEAVRAKRAQILKTLKIPTEKEIKKFTLRAQYQGYRKIKGVKKNSSTETYFKIRAFLEHSHWRGVPIILESGKRLGKVRKEIVVEFKAKGGFGNRISFIIEPEEKIVLRLFGKKPGWAFRIRKRPFEILYRKKKRKVQYVEEYAKLLLDCIGGDQTLFVNTEEVKSMWRFIDPILDAWQKNLVPLKTYPPKTNQILKAGGDFQN